MSRGRCSVCRKRGHNRSAHTPEERAAAQRRAAEVDVVNVAGVLAHWSGTCSRCGGEAHQSRVIRRSNGEWIHAACATGADDR